MPNEIILYSTPTGNKKIEVFFQDEDFWLTQKRMAELFGVEVNTVNYHLKEIFKTKELTEDSVIRKIRTTARDWVSFLLIFLELSDYPILEDKGKVSALEAKLKAEQEYGIYRKTQDENYFSDFDKEIKRIEGKE